LCGLDLNESSIEEPEISIENQKALKGLFLCPERVFCDILVLKIVRETNTYFVMSESFIRHFISAIALIIAGLIFFAGYSAGTYGWWFGGFAVIIVYFIVYALIEI